MGIVINQSIKNTVITYVGFAIGAINTLFMYPHFLGDDFYGLTNYILSSANVIFPLMAFGVHNTLIKFFSEYKTEKEKSQFFSFILAIPLLAIVPIFIFGTIFYPEIATFLSKKNNIVYDYVWQIPIIGLCMAYFEIFYAWVKVHLQSVFGNFIKEVGLRILISIFLFGVYFNFITVEQFITATMYVYLASMLIMFFYANKVQTIQFSFKLPTNAKPIIIYSSFIILSGSVANILIDIDKTMLNQYLDLKQIAYYTVAGFIATVIAVPSRAMHQITYPITAKLMIENKHDELNDLYKKTSITLQIVGGLVYIGLLVNINQIYLLLPENYRGGVFVFFIIGLSKYFDLILGNNNSIIFNSKYYRAVLFLGLLLGLLAVTLNMIFIPKYGIDGAAIATLISITLYSIAKLLFVVLKMKLYPFTIKTIYALAIGLICFFGFYYWDFPFHPIINIMLKSVLVSLVYVGIVYKVKLSEDINGVIERILKITKLIK
ncbi:polysaccharide biosynthesis C-terminal domain-containing protein [Flavobacterium macrobrachii]|uniref:Polysaccharide biosynthesis C-terminal domain-containing protein n=1 Tax=Flavobacterium macrobrachii TaxID=591204 RepID=A0ABS2CW17_9FLAO|nr:polysaccharide biosynthesis C-terminal domain-containing protein [Flavobacterium macrobrachii]MBM6499145.1 polysaccharide biosynthesis C-terminal domain-containing protein [Flavobacterium macrobrachii]